MHLKHDHPFAHCPACSREGLQFNQINRFSCRHCGFVFFHNTAAACGAILTVGSGPGSGPDAGRILLLRRGREPAAGMLDFPGGFIDPGESAEEALVREIREETGLTVEELVYLCSAPNQYRYGDVEYNTCDLVFTGTVPSPPAAIQETEVSGYVLLRPEEVRVEQIAFPSLRNAMTLYLARYQGRSAAP